MALGVRAVWVCGVACTPSLGAHERVRPRVAFTLSLWGLKAQELEVAEWLAFEATVLLNGLPGLVENEFPVVSVRAR